MIFWPPCFSLLLVNAVRSPPRVHAYTHHAHARAHTHTHTHAPQTRTHMQMEMRTILAHLFRDFTFTLAAPTAGYDRETYQGINRGTMGPQDLNHPEVRADGSMRPSLGMHVF